MPFSHSLGGIRPLALSTATFALLLYVLQQVLSIPTGFGIEDYLGWVDDGAIDEMAKQWKNYGVQGWAIAYLFIDTVLFMPLYGSLLLALSEKFLYAVARDAVRGESNPQAPRWLSWALVIRTGMVFSLLLIDLVENVGGLLRMNAPQWGLVALMGLALVVWVLQDWLKRLPPPRENGNDALSFWRQVVGVTVVLIVVFVVFSLCTCDWRKELPLHPGAWSHYLKVSAFSSFGVLDLYLFLLLALIAASFFGFFFDGPTATKTDDAGASVRQGYTEAAAFRRAVGAIVLRSRYVLGALVVFAGLALVMNQGRDVLYSTASMEGWPIPKMIGVLLVSALGMWAFAFACWLWTRAVCLIRSPDVEKEPPKDAPVRPEDLFARDWARLLGLLPAVLLVLLCGATLRDAVWANNTTATWWLAIFAISALFFGWMFVWRHQKHNRRHYFNVADFEGWQDVARDGEYRFLGLIPPFFLPFAAAAGMFLTRMGPLGDWPPTAIATFLFALTLWLSLLGWMSLNEERIALPWVGVLILTAGVFGYLGWTQNHMVGGIVHSVQPDEFSLLQGNLLAMGLAAVVLVLFALLVAFNSQPQKKDNLTSRFLDWIRTRAGSKNASGLPFWKGALFVGVALAVAVGILIWGDSPGSRQPGAQDHALAEKTTLGKAMKDWLDHLYEHRKKYAPDDRDLRVFFVNAEGGGSLSAYWTAIVLRALQADETFLPRTFSYSGVSGGAVGMAVDRACRLHQGNSTTRGSAVCVDQFGRADLVSPLVGAWLFEDVLAGIIPGTTWCTIPGCGFLSRGVWFEQAMQQAVRELATGLLASHAHHEPYLFLNSTWVESGARAIASELAIADADFPGASDQLDLLNRDLTLVTAAHNSARFPFVNAIGALRAPKTKPCPLKSDRGEICGHLADGGYFDNSGAHTTQDLLRALEACLTSASRFPECRFTDDQRDWLRMHLVPQTIAIRNGVRPETAWKPPCRKPEQPTASDLKYKENTRTTDLYQPWKPGCRGEFKLYVEQLGPLVTAINTTGIGANGQVAEAAAPLAVERLWENWRPDLVHWPNRVVWLWEDWRPAHPPRAWPTVNIDLIEDSKVLYPLGWHLSKSARDGMKKRCSELAGDPLSMFNDLGLTVGETPSEVCSIDVAAGDGSPK